MSYIKKTLLTLTIATSLLAGAACQHPTKTSSVDYEEAAKNTQSLFTNNRCIPKGGVGIIKGDIFVATREKNNVILFSKGNTEWQSAHGGNQVVFVYNGTVLDGEFPKDFDINKSIMICFAKDRISFLDFSDFKGGFYHRSFD